MQNERTKLYIVDDESSIRAAYARLARSANIEVQSFGSIEEFMQADVSDKNACLICDLAMPGMNGIALPDLLAAACRELPVIFVTGYDTEQTRAMAQQSGAVAYFRKPVDGQALLDTIAWALSPQSRNIDHPLTP